MIPTPITDGTVDTVDTGTVDTGAGFRSTGPAVGEAGAAGVPGDELPGATA